MQNSSFKILIAEDQQEIVNFLKQGLQEEEYQVLVAKDGKQALEMALKNSVDLILLDWLMPKLNGIEVCKTLRAKQFKAPIIFLTAKDTIEDTIDGLKSGANDYVKKPFNFEELLARIETHLRIFYNIDDILELGHIKMNVSKHQVFCDENKINLTEKEYNFLKYLMQNKGKVCERNAILEHVWDINFDYDSGVLDVFMNAIRKKLNLKKNELIKTVRGVGFMADAS
ncbi:response regulator transcription factor [Flavobacterium sp. CS20]|jgi:DNA-binding response OmpR family regulator|uniref:response regulator transcription factor n=1 Tax=Flavobacterium sp. CS20 TaxID=2775246 RepID=UPI001B3A0599|nr:response regulator transcription factor [Flavobacterium sp. CS20]QTY28243.1 response regulator transcription factor [Flavobacterium sp. CS20]